MARTAPDAMIDSASRCTAAGRRAVWLARGPRPKAAIQPNKPRGENMPAQYRVCGDAKRSRSRSRVEYLFTAQKCRLRRIARSSCWPVSEHGSASGPSEELRGTRRKQGLGTSEPQDG